MNLSLHTLKERHDKSSPLFYPLADMVTIRKTSVPVWAPDTDLHHQTYSQVAHAETHTHLMLQF